MLRLLRWLFNQNEKHLRRYNIVVESINALEPEFQALADDELKPRTLEFRERLDNGETLDDILPEAFALVRETGRRILKMRHFDVQLMGGIGLHEGKAVEMKTGEGKTLVATLPAYLNGLTRKGVHIVTVNDYLAERDRNWMGQIFEALGLTVGLIKSEMSPSERRAAYGCDITYGTNNEFGFDYLRDNMAIRREHCVQREHAFSIIDEVDSILVDEARTPLIISGPVAHSNNRYREMNQVVSSLVQRQNRTLNEYLKRIEKAVTDNEDYEYLGIDLFRVHRGSPKEPRLLKLLENVQLRRLLQQTELDFIELKTADWLEDLYFVIDERGHSVEINDKGRAFLSSRDPDLFVIPDMDALYEEERIIREDESLTDAEKAASLDAIQGTIRKTQAVHLERNEIIHNVQQLCKAYVLFRRDVDYVVQDNKVVIVDEFTGRLMPGRRFSDGLHQALEAKENVKIEGENQVLATITLQNYFRLYDKLSGMTGTCETEAKEFHEIYKLDVVVIPTHRQIIREDLDDVIFKTERAKYRAIVETIKELYHRQQPVLVGTISIEKSEWLSKLLQHESIPHEVLNAKHHRREAEIVASAGEHGSVTIATNMAGRGTDIVLDEGAHEAGGLFVLGTERHESRRIDNQLRGRSGRLGDPGASQFFLSLEDDLMRLFGSDNIAGIMEKLGMEEDEPIQHRLVSGALERAQSRVEERNFNIRKHVLEYDDVMNLQRDVIYTQRRRVLEDEDMKETVTAMMEDTAEELVDLYMSPALTPSEWDTGQLKTALERLFPIAVDSELLDDLPERDTVIDSIHKQIHSAYESRERFIGAERLRELERIVVLQIVDQEWKDHLYAMDSLKQGIHLRAYGQRDPLVEYKKEGAEMFEAMISRIKSHVSELLFRLQLAPYQEGPKLEEQTMFTNKGDGAEPAKRTSKKVGRNEPCPCGSGKKHKKCCG